MKGIYKMIDSLRIEMKSESTSSDVEKVVQQLKTAGLTVSVNETTPIYLSIQGSITDSCIASLKTNPVIAELKEVTGTYRLTSREFHPGNSKVQVGDIEIGGSDFVTMAGPCSVETLEQMMTCARIAHEGGAKVLRGGAFKPRTSPYAFQGLEEEGLIYLRQAADEYGLKVITEVMDEANLELVCKYTDIIQIGARNMQNFRLLEAVGKTTKPVALKRGISGTIDEWLHAAEYIAAKGNTNIIFVERGIRTYETATRNTFDVSAVPVVQKLSHFPIIVDPSHGVGVWDIVPPMALAGVAAGASGMIVEIHPNPSEAWSDGPQSLNEQNYLTMMKKVNILSQTMKELAQFD